MIAGKIKKSQKMVIFLALALGLFSCSHVQAGPIFVHASEIVQTPPPFPPPGPWPPPMPSPPEERGKACFFDGVNFSGASFCVNTGRRIMDLGAWANRITSISIEGSAEAKVCLVNNLRGDCLNMSWSVSDLTIYGDFWNNAILSVEVR